MFSHSRKIALEIYTSQGVTAKNIFGGERALHLGCGYAKIPGAVGVDKLKVPGVDVVWNLDDIPWPFESQSIDAIIGHSVVEHLNDLPQFFEEVWRVLRPGGRIVITVPYFRSVDAFTDVTHKHFFTARSLDYFLDTNTSLARYDYTPHKFKEIGRWYGWPRPSRNPLVRLFKFFIERNRSFYDQYLSLFFPVKILIWELEK